MKTIPRKKLYSSLLKLLFTSHCGHIGSCLSCLDIIATIWIRAKGKNDIFLLSKGHAAPSLYVVMNHVGLIDDKTLATFHDNGTTLPAHTPNNHFPEQIPFPTGSLGHGLSLCTGMALAKRMKKEPGYVYCLMSDGECNEGQVWEAAQFASNNELANLVVFIDRNQIQAFGRTADVLGDPATRAKWEAFGFDVFETDGHDPEALTTVIADAKKSTSPKPKLIICNTTKGNAVSFMANTIDWHYLPMKEQQYLAAIDELDTIT